MTMTEEDREDRRRFADELRERVRARLASCPTCGGKMTVRTLAREIGVDYKILWRFNRGESISSPSIALIQHYFAEDDHLLGAEELDS